MMFTKRSGRVVDEAAALATARHPGVVELVDAAGDVLRTLRVDAQPVAALGPMPAAQVAGLTAAVAATLADLHDLGVVHGGIDATHVIVTSEGRPLLCSLGRGGDPADDVAALGRMVTGLLAMAPPEQDGHRLRPGLWRRGAARHGGRRDGGNQGGSGLGGGLTHGRGGRGRRLGPMLSPPAAPAMAELAARAMAPEPSDRPTARQLADAIPRQIPAACLPAPAAAMSVGSVPRLEPRRAVFIPRRPALSAAAGGVAGLVAVAGVLGGVTLAGEWALSRRTSTPKPQSPADVTRASTANGASAREGSGVAATGGRRAPVATRVWPVEPLDVNDGVLTYRGARYAIGEPEDSLVAGDWACTGTPTLALLRREAGQIFAFDGWPNGEGVLTARRVGLVKGATDLRAVDTDGNGCHELEVSRQGATSVTLRVGS